MRGVYKIINTERKMSFPMKQNHGDMTLNNKLFKTSKTMHLYNV